jgi:glutathione S-transferase
MITVYHLFKSRFERIVRLMEELGFEHKIERFQREPSRAAPDALKGIHPLGKAPVIRDGDTMAAESGAIVDYIVHRYGAAIMMTFPFTTTRLFLDCDLAPFPNILACLKRIEARPAYQNAMQLAGPNSDHQ